MDELPLGTVPTLEDFLLRVHGPHTIVLTDEPSVYLVTGAINQGFDSSMTAIGAVGRWTSNGLELTIHDGTSVYSLICRLIEIELSHPDEFDVSPAALAHDILNHFGYGWIEREAGSVMVQDPLSTSEVSDGEEQEQVVSFRQEEG